MYPTCLEERIQIDTTILDIFSYKSELVKCTCQKNDSNEFECLYLAIHVVEISENFTTYFQVNMLQDRMVTCVKKVSFQKFVTCTSEMVVFEHFGENIVKEFKGLSKKS